MPDKQKGNANRPHPKLSRIEIPVVFTDFDAIETFNRVLLKKRRKRSK